MKHDKTDIIETIFSRSRPLNFEKNVVILGNGYAPDGVYFISSGFIKIYSISDSGDEYLHIIYGTGELFPLPWALLGTHPESLFYETISSCILLRVSREWFLNVIRTNASFSYALSLKLAAQYRILSDRIDNLEYRKASERVAYRLLFLASRFGAKNGRGIIINAPITHELFANSINLARESVSRQMERLEHQQIIERYRHRILITDIRGLASKLSQPNNIKNWNLQL